MVRSSKTRISLEKSSLSPVGANRSQLSNSPSSSIMNESPTVQVNRSERLRRKEVTEISLLSDYAPPKYHAKKSWKALSPYSKRLFMHFVRRAKKLIFSYRIIVSSCLLTIPDSRKDDILELYNRAVNSSLNIMDVCMFEKNYR